jgi:hypothetical protein
MNCPNGCKLPSLPQRGRQPTITQPGVAESVPMSLSIGQTVMGGCARVLMDRLYCFTYWIFLKTKRITYLPPPPSQYISPFRT